MNGDVGVTMEGRDVYLRTTDKRGTVSHSHHRVWHRDRFILMHTVATEKEGGTVLVVDKATHDKATRGN